MRNKLIILGCGSSMGVPRADGYWGQCDPRETKNYRTRCSAILKNKDTNILIDTSPDLRTQLINNKIKNISDVIYTHMHGDQVHGINDLRIFSLINKKKISIYADIETRKHLFKNFTYCFKDTLDYKAILKLKKLKKKNIFNNSKNKVLINTIRVQHGNIKSQAIIINKTCAYLSDANKIFEKDLKYFKKLKFLIIDCLRFKKHPSHFNLEDVLKLVKILKPKRTILTNLHSDFDYNNLKKILPNNIIPAFDGMTLTL